MYATIIVTPILEKVQFYFIMGVKRCYYPKC